MSGSVAIPYCYLLIYFRDKRFTRIYYYASAMFSTVRLLRHICRYQRHRWYHRDGGNPQVLSDLADETAVEEATV
jgi:hypothetical protein